MVFLKNALMCILKKEKKVKLINHDCLPILLLLYIILYIMLAYLCCLLLYVMLFVCIMLFLSLIFANAFCHHALSWFIDT